MWDPAQYEKFKDERSQPFFDLLDLVRSKNPKRVVDLGCGTGALTKILHEKIGAASTLGIDSSSEMLKKAPRDVRGLSFEECGIEPFCDRELAARDAGPADAYRASDSARFDLIFSNAALHWVSHHETLFAKLGRMLNTGGELAIQMPANFDHASHRVAMHVAQSAPFADLLGGYVRETQVLAPELYAALLDKLGFVDANVRLQVYAHRLASRADLVEWVKGTLLTDYAVRLSEKDYVQFLAEYTRVLFECTMDTRPYFYPFKRILLRARKSG